MANKISQRTFIALSVVVVVFSHAHSLDWCAFVLDGVKNVTDGPTDGRTVGLVNLDIFSVKCWEVFLSAADTALTQP